MESEIIKIKPYQRKCVKINETVVVVSTIAMIVTGCATVSAINDMGKQIETDHDHMKGTVEYFNIWLGNPKLISVYEKSIRINPMFLLVCTVGSVRFVCSLEITQIFWCIFHDFP